ncbi:MAG: oligosaccharide flippase family protein [Anaerolineaceae bacterium]|nr:oligosaccharide flippase family protein [Anaerolineaceae bacterium]
MEEEQSGATFSRFFSGTLSTGFGSVFIIVSGFIGVMLTARWVPAEEIGVFVLVQLIVTFMVGLTDFGLGLTVTQLIAQKQTGTEKHLILNTSIIFRIATALIGSMLALVGKRILFDFFGASLYTNLLVYVPIFILIESLLQLYQSVLEGLFKFKSIALVGFITGISNFLALLVLVGYFKLGIMGLIFVRLTSRSIGLLASFFTAKIPFRFEFSLAKLKQMLRFGLPLYANYILDFTFNQAGTFIIGALLGPANIAFFEYARKIPDSLEMLYNAFRQVYFPFLSKLFGTGRKGEASHMLNHSIRLISFFGIFGTLVALLFGEEIIVMLFSEEFLPSVPAFYVLMINLTLIIIDHTLGYSLVAVGESNKPILINSARAIVTLGAYLLLIKPLGIVGAAISTILGTIIANPINIYFLRRKQVEAKFSTFLKPFAIFFALYVPANLLLTMNWWMKIAAFLVYLFLAFALSVITLDDITTITHEFKEFLKRRRQPESAAD